MNYQSHNKYSSYLGNSVNITTDCKSCPAEIRADVVLTPVKGTRVWGVISDCCGKPVPNALVKLVRVTNYQGAVAMKGVAHTVSDCQGFYQFDICDEDPCSHYKIVVGTANTGEEVVLHNEAGECNACVAPTNYPCVAQCPPPCPPPCCCDECIKHQA